MLRKLRPRVSMSTFAVVFKSYVLLFNFISLSRLLCCLVFLACACYLTYEVSTDWPYVNTCRVPRIILVKIGAEVQPLKRHIALGNRAAPLGEF